MSSGVPGQVSGVGPNSVRPGPALLGLTDADLKVSATLPDDTGKPSRITLRYLSLMRYTDLPIKAASWLPSWHKTPHCAPLHGQNLARWFRSV